MGLSGTERSQNLKPNVGRQVKKFEELLTISS